MRKGITLRAFGRELKLERRLDLARDAGFDGVEVNLEPGEQCTIEAGERDLLALRRTIEDRGLTVSSVYSRLQWYSPITSDREETRQRGREILDRLVCAAPLLGTDAVLVVPGAVDNALFADDPELVRYDVAYRRAQETLAEVAQGPAAQHGVHLAVENVWNKFLLSPLELSRFVDEIGSPWVGVYFDVGNVLRTGVPEHWITILGSRIQRVHFKDFRESSGSLDGFVGLLEGDVNWPAVAAALRSIRYESWVVGEVLPAYRHHGDRLIYETSKAMEAILGETTKHAATADAATRERG
jgi:L-ribulose-5-phosphate 3-epimerase